MCVAMTNVGPWIFHCMAVLMAIGVAVQLWTGTITRSGRRCPTPFEFVLYGLADPDPILQQDRPAAFWSRIVFQLITIGLFVWLDFAVR